MGTNSDFSLISPGKRKQFGLLLCSKIRECTMGRWMGSKHNPGELFTYARTPIRWQPPERLTAAASRECKPQTYTSEKPQFCSSLSALHITLNLRSPSWLPLGSYRYQRSSPATNPSTYKQLSTCYGYQACFQTSHYYTRLYCGGVGAGEVGESILKSTARCLFTTPHWKRRNFSSQTQPFSPLPPVPLHRARQSQSSAHGRPPRSSGCPLNSSWSRWWGRKAPHALSSQWELSRPASPRPPGQERAGRKPEAPRFGQAQRPPLPQVCSRSLPCHSFSGISLGKTGEAGDVRPKKSKEKGQGRTGGSIFWWEGNLSRAEVR